MAYVAVLAASWFRQPVYFALHSFSPSSTLPFAHAAVNALASAENVGNTF